VNPVGPLKPVRPQALTLSETIVAIFLLLAGFTVVAQLFLRGMRYSTSITVRQQAVAIAERRLEDIRAWSRAHHHPAGTLPMTDWGPFATTPVQDAFDSQYEVSTEFSQPEFFSPCSRFEGVYPNPTDRFQLTSQRTQVTVTVRWGGGSVRLTTFVAAPTGQLSWHWRPLLALVSYWVVAAPPSPAGTSPFDPLPAASAATYTLQVVPVSPTSAGALTLSHDQSARYDAILQANVSGSQRPLPCRVRWASIGPGTGTLRTFRNNNQVEFRHQTVLNGLVVYADGLDAQLEAVATYRGRIFRARTPLLTLTP